jgi:mRNA-degrading endonuclease RelE of RelBE toxin-antitoxin system
MLYLQFTETPRFIKQASKILGENEISKLQFYLIENPDAGVVIQNSGGIRKLRWASSGHGKRGGSRVIYYFAIAHERILLLDIYSKNEKSDLSKLEIAELKLRLETWLKQI